MSLQVKNLSFHYGRRPVLKNIDFRVEVGEAAGLVGPNGAGKSTLLKCINRILTPDVGAVWVDERNIARTSLKERARLFGYVPQSAPNAFAATVFDTVLLGRRPYVDWTVDAASMDKVFDVLVAMNLDHMAMRQFNELSGGEQQRVLMARALAQEPKILLLDEPTSNLDVKHQMEVMDLVMNIVREEKMSVIMAIHDLNLASQYSDRLLFMKEGELQICGAPEETLVPVAIKQVYGIDSMIHSESGRPYIIPLRCAQ